MKFSIEIKKPKRKIQVIYIRNLHTMLPEEPIIPLEFELEEAVRWDISKIEAEYFIFRLKTQDES